MAVINEKKIQEAMNKTTAMVIYGHIYEKCKIVKNEDLFVTIEINDIDERFVDHSMVVSSSMTIRIPKIDFTSSNRTLNSKDYYNYWMFLEDFMGKNNNKPNISNETIRNENINEKKTAKKTYKVNAKKVNNKPLFENYLKNIKDVNKTENFENINKNFSERFINKLKNIENVPERLIQEISTNPVIICDNFEGKYVYTVAYGFGQLEVVLTGWNMKNETITFKVYSSKSLYTIPIMNLATSFKISKYCVVSIENIKAFENEFNEKKTDKAINNIDEIEIKDFGSIEEMLDFIFNKKKQNIEKKPCDKCAKKENNKKKPDKDLMDSLISMIELFGGSYAED